VGGHRRVGWITGMTLLPPSNKLAYNEHTRRRVGRDSEEVRRGLPRGTPLAFAFHNL
jgi:hypothetical protein